MDPDEDPPEDSPHEFPSVDELIGPFLTESSLWPVLIVAIASGGAFGAAMIVLTLIDRNLFAAAALFLILGMSIDVFIQSRRKASYRNIAKMIGLVWCAAFAFTALAIWTGIAL